MSLQELSLKAVPNPGEQARKVLPPWHMVRIAVEERDFSEMRDRFREEHKLRFRYVLIELRVLPSGFWILFRETLERLPFIRLWVDTAHKDSFTAIVKTCVFVVYCRSVMQNIRWKKMKYCPFTKWLNFYKNICSHCERMFEFVLTLDGLILTWKHEEVDTNREHKTLSKWYKGSSIIQRLGR